MGTNSTMGTPRSRLFEVTLSSQVLNSRLRSLNQNGLNQNGLCCFCYMFCYVLLRFATFTCYVCWSPFRLRPRFLVDSDRSLAYLGRKGKEWKP